MKDRARARYLPVHYLPAILGTHFTGIGINEPVTSTCRFRASPAGLTTMPGGLTVLFIGSHHSLSATKQMHFI